MMGLTGLFPSSTVVVPGVGGLRVGRGGGCGTTTLKLGQIDATGGGFSAEADMMAG
jgi:hypothetical protein